MKALTVREYSTMWQTLELTGGWNIPMLRKDSFEVKEVLGFNYCMSTPELKENEAPTVHFFLDDHEFERVWNYPKRYFDILRRFNGCFTPDFSLYNDYPLAVQLFNTFRNRCVGAWWQNAGLKVIPTVGWGAEETFDFCFDGVEKGSTVVVATRGVMRDGEDVREAFKVGYREMMKQIEPELIYVYGSDPKRLELDGNTRHLKYDNQY